MNTLTIIVLIIVAMCAFRGMTEGFIKTTFRFVLNVVVFVLSMFITPIFLKIVFANFLRNGMEAVSQLVILIIIFALLRFGARLIVASLNVIAKLPVIKSLNRLLGFLAGLLQGAVIVYAIFMVAMVFIETSFGVWIQTMCMESPFLQVLYQNNPLVYLVEKHLFQI